MNEVRSLELPQVSVIKPQTTALLTLGFLVFGIGVSLGITGLASNPAALPCG